MENDLTKYLKSSPLFASNIAYIEELYDAYLKDPNSVEKYWQDYFKQLLANATSETRLSEVREHFKNIMTTPVAEATSSESIETLHKQVAIEQLITAYRAYGHVHANLDPLGLMVRPEVSVLKLGHYGFVQRDLDTVFDARTFKGLTQATLRDIHQALIKTYSETFAIEYMQISNEEQRKWLQQRIESVQAHPSFSALVKKRILKKLIQAETLEKYLGARYVGQTRFSLEGGGSLIPMLDELTQRSGMHGVKEIIIGMGHRGRISVLLNIIGKPLESLLQEFEGKTVKPGYSGDVKYHIGSASDIKTAGGVVHLALTFNPSHLEIIDPVVVGSVRARQDSRADYDHGLIVPVLIHGDAAFAGQGVVMETLNLSQTRGFGTGGTIHIIVNNQVGFTTSNPHDARSSMYCTDIGKMIDAPIFHVNGDDPEACVFAMQLALDYRMEFKTDVFIDLVCYRRLGHNEGDEPSATQPIMYKKIRQHPRTPDIYAKKLVEEKVVTDEEVKSEDDHYREILDTNKPIIETVPKSEVKQFYANWNPYKDKNWDVAYDTRISLKDLQRIGQAITTLPEGFTLQAQVAKEYENRRLMIEGKLPFNWGMAEILAYGTLLDKGYSIRLSGQDCGRGTFAHRHAILYDQDDGTAYMPLAHIEEDQSPIWINDSTLSEEGVLGFEYGYATTEPETLVIWEAQYGDFMNGAQVVIDQFITSGEQKWARLCGLTMFLPHGYQGAGPEHSSARLERFLQSAAQQNIQVCVPSTPSQIYHLIRRQMLRPYRKPLIVFTPKNLLRHKLVVSTLSDLTDGKFELLIPEIDDLNLKKVTKVILCAGKVYYDLLEKRRDAKLETVAIVRLEQLYPFPEEALKAELKRYPNAKTVVWCQEEPKNQGSWYSITHRLNGCLVSGQKLDYAGRPASASPATGYSSIHAQEQAALVQAALGL